MLGGILTQGGAIATSAILARTFSVAEYGIIRQVTFVYALLVPIVTGSVPMSILYYLPKLSTETERAAFVRQTIAILATIGAAIGIGVLVAADLIGASLNNPALARPLRLTAAYPLFLLGGSWLSPYFVARGQARRSTSYSVATALLFLGAASVPVLFSTDLESYLMAYVAAAACAMVLAFYHAGRRPWQVAGAAPAAGLREQLAYALPLGAGAIVSVWGLKIDQAVVANRFSVEDYAIYSAGAIELPLVALVSSSVFSVLLPDLSRLLAAGDRERTIALWKSSVRKSVTILFPLFGLALLLAVPLIITLYSAKYAASAAIFTIYLFYIPLRTVSFGLLLRAAGLTKYDLIGSLLFLVVNSALAVGLVGPLGLYGPATAAVISTYLLAGYFLLMTRRRLGFSITDLLPGDTLLSLAVPTLVPIPIVWVAFDLSVTQPVALWRYAAASVVYAAVVIGSYALSGRWRHLR